MASKASDSRPGPTVCRCCFAEGCYKDISTEYFWMGKREVYSEMLTETFDVTIAYSQTGGPNSNSRLICEPCISRLRDAADFKRQVQECEKVFLLHLAQPTSSIDFEIEEPSIREEVKLERVKLEAKMDDDDDFEDNIGFADDDDDDLDDQPLMKLASKVPKEESDELLKKLLLDDEKKLEKRKSSTKVKAAPAKKIKKKESPKPSVSKPQPKTVADKKKKDVEQVGVNATTRNAAVILRNSTAYPFQIAGISMKCCFCASLYDDPNSFRSHCDSNHVNTEQDIVSDKYQTRVDITNLSCKHCRNKDTFSSLERLVKHLNDMHDTDIDPSSGFGLAPVRITRDRYQCAVCSNIFKGVVSLYRHSGKHFYRHVCEKCGKNYQSSTGLERHVNDCDMNQLGVGMYICRFCRKRFFTLQEKRKHSRMASNYRCKPYKCQSCRVGFFSWEQRQAHLETLHGQEQRFFPCVECKIVFKKRILLYRHFKASHTEDLKCQDCGRTFATKREFNDHLNTHLAEKPLKCHICDKGFAAKKNLSAHLKIHNDSEKLPCPACGKLFVARSRMEEHIRKHHLEFCAQRQ